VYASVLSSTSPFDLKSVTSFNNINDILISKTTCMCMLCVYVRVLFVCCACASVVLVLFMYVLSVHVLLFMHVLLFVHVLVLFVCFMLRRLCTEVEHCVVVASHLDSGCRQRIRGPPRESVHPLRIFER
jgi:hypothetical protein